MDDDGFTTRAIRVTTRVPRRERLPLVTPSQTVAEDLRADVQSAVVAVRAAPAATTTAATA